MNYGTVTEEIDEDAPCSLQMSPITNVFQEWTSVAQPAFNTGNWQWMNEWMNQAINQTIKHSINTSLF